MADQPQERDKDVVTYGAFAGVRNDVAPERFSLVDLEAADNVDIDASGQLSTRNGYTLRRAGATHSLWSDRAALAFCVQGTVLYRVNADYSITAVKTGLTAGLRMSYAKVNDRVYFTNGVDAGVYDNGAVRSWGLPVPPVPSYTAGLGQLAAGSYQFVMTYVRADGQESGAGIAGRADVSANGALTLGLAVPTDPTITQKNIYVSPPNGNVLYLAATVPAATTVFAYVSAATSYSYDLKTQFCGPPPAGHLVAYFNSRTYVAVGDVLFPSEPFAYELFDLRSYVPLGARCTLLAPMEDKESLDQPGQNSGLFAGTTESCGALVGVRPEEFRYVPKTAYGAIEGALDYVEGSLYANGDTGARMLPIWLTTQGICVGLPGLHIRNVTTQKFSFPAAGVGAAVFQPSSQRFVAVSNY